jgi:hypothetical protein
LCDLTGLDEGIAYMADKISAAHSEAERRPSICTADNVELWPGGVPVPARLHQVEKPFGVVGMHVREEDSVKLPNIDIRL